MKKLCLFDLDGTLIDPHTSITKGMQHALTFVGIKIEDRNKLNCFIGPPIRDSLQQFYNFTNSEEIELVVNKYLEYFEEKGLYENTLYPGIIDMLNRLKDAGLTLTIATSKPMVNAIKIAKHLKFDQYFDIIAGCELDGTRSRKKEVIDYVLSNDTYKKQVSVMIGDRKYDIIGAREVDIASIGVTWGYGSREELKKEKPTLIVDSIEELIEALCCSHNNLTFR